MHNYRSLEDLQPLSETDPELWREVYGFMTICLYEDEEADLEFQVAEEDDTDQLETLSDPEEWALIEIHTYRETRRIYRVIFVTEVIFVPGELASHLSFINS